MQDIIERAVRDLGKISVDNLIHTDEIPINKNGLYPDDYDPITGRFLYPDDGQHAVNKKRRNCYGKKES